MSLRCSLLGHSYGEAEIEREREEQGSEVVVTVREFEECERCGDRKVVTENKEVTALQSPTPDLESAESESSADDPGASGGTEASDGTATADVADASADATGSTSDASAGPAGGQSDVQLGADAEVAGGGDDAEIIGGSSDSGESSKSASSSGSSESSEANASSDSSGDGGSDTASPSAEDDFEQPQSAADDDGVILDDDGDSSADGDDRTPGEWPDAETTHPAEADDGPGDWPAVGREDGDEGFDAEPAEAGSADVEFGGGLTPESAGEVDDESDEVEFVNAEGDALRSRDGGASNTELSSGISAGADAPSLSGPADDPDVDAEFVCPECDYRETVSGSSLRAGDICPECSRGYLAQE